MSRSLPVVSVLMPVYNAAAHVREAIESILSQTFSDFELLIFNDGSTDASSAIIRSIHDERILFFDYQENSGYVAHLNEGLQLAKGKYIARMDADDIALPTRFARQVALLDSQLELGLCGTGFQSFGITNAVAELPLTNQQIRENMLAYCPIGHPTVMFRRAITEQYRLVYDKGFMPAEDYKMWYDFSQVSELQNLSEVLLRYRVHPHQISAYQSATQRANADRVRVLQLTDKGFQITAEEQLLYCRLLDPYTELSSAAEFDKVIRLMQKIERENVRLQAYDAHVFTKLFTACWRRLVNNIRHYSPAHLVPILMRPKTVGTPLTTFGWMRFTVKALLFWKVRTTS